MDKDLLRKTLKVQSVSGSEWRMFAHIVRELKSYGAHVVQDAIGNLYAQKGSADNFPCVVAHIDTVHDFESDFQLLVVGDKIAAFNAHTMRQVGIGGDDKVGVFIALECMRMYDNIKAAFFVSEETGCDGSDLADMAFFDDCRFVLQADRKGSSDFVTTASGVELSGKEFFKAIKPYLHLYGYKAASGMMTDVMALKSNGLKVCAANVSCGYYNPHTASEYVVVRDIERCYDLFCAIIDNCCKVYHHKYVKPSYPSYSYGGGYGYGGGYNDGYFDWVKPAPAASSKKIDRSEMCDNCLRWADVTHYSRQYNVFLCTGCYVAYK